MKPSQTHIYSGKVLCVYGSHLSLSTGCCIFTKIVHYTMLYWHAKGLRILVYLDDGLCSVTGKQAALEASQLVRSTLYTMQGLVDTLTKSIWQPTQHLQWLGFVIDVELGLIKIPQKSLLIYSVPRPKISASNSYGCIRIYTDFASYIRTYGHYASIYGSTV